MKIKEFCNMTELSSTIMTWSKLTGLKVAIKDSDGEVIASTLPADDGQGSEETAGDEFAESASEGSSYGRTTNIEITLNEEVIGTAEVTESSDSTGVDINDATTLLDQLLNNFVSAQYFLFANDKVLSRLSEGINETVRLVKEVTSSTNNLKEIQKRQKIVAINASIEAARVGQAGRGFAVVAEEVKKLSDASSEANGKIERVVNQIRNIVSTLSMNKSEDA